MPAYSNRLGLRLQEVVATQQLLINTKVQTLGTTYGVTISLLLKPFDHLQLGGSQGHQGNSVVLPAPLSHSDLQSRDHIKYFSAIPRSLPLAKLAFRPLPYLHLRAPLSEIVRVLPPSFRFNKAIISDMEV